MKHSRQGGFSIVAAVFFVVVIALLAGFLVSIGSLQRTTSAYSIVATRAHFAALGGVEWGVHQVLANPLAPDCFASPTSFVVAGTGSGNFTLTVNCSETEISEGSDDYSVFDIDVSAEFGTTGQDDYFRREVSASVSTLL